MRWTSAKSARQSAVRMVDNTLLIGGPYVPPAVRRADWLDDEIYGRVEVGGYSDGRIPWPKRKRTGKASLILCGDLIRAVKTESSLAIHHWFGVSVTTVWKWRKALGVEFDNCAGTQRLYRDYKPEKLPDEIAATGRETARTEAVRAKVSATKRGKSVPPQTKAGLLRAAKAKKGREWGARANAWMLEGKRKKQQEREDGSDDSV